MTGSTSGRVILTPDQRARVFVSTTLTELAAEREAVQRRPALRGPGAGRRPAVRPDRRQRRRGSGDHPAARRLEAVEVCSAVWLFWWRRGYIDEGVRYLRRVLVDPDALPPAARGRALVVAAMAYVSGQDDEARTTFEQARELARAAGDDVAEAHALGPLGSYAARAGDIDRGRELLGQAYELAVRGNRLWLVSLFHCRLGMIAFGRVTRWTPGGISTRRSGSPPASTTSSATCRTPSGKLWMRAYVPPWPTVGPGSAELRERLGRSATTGAGARASGSGSPARWRRRFGTPKRAPPKGRPPRSRSSPASGRTRGPPRPAATSTSAGRTA
ncbi:hypothetical protein AB0J82_32915 [Asanoa sp. NPDC049518]|uniref:tetratricopeptide repeat protein n=1 Tax=unclassified Asanoa TaxID=2685164 RepID=UPI003439114A